MVIATWFVFEVACLVVALLGVWLVFPPAAMILGGVAGAVAAERAMAERKRTRREGAR
jgi:CHASE2 domain-containing sensor protein